MFLEQLSIVFRITAVEHSDVLQLAELKRYRTDRRRALAVLLPPPPGVPRPLPPPPNAAAAQELLTFFQSEMSRCFVSMSLFLAPTPPSSDPAVPLPFFTARWNANPVDQLTAPTSGPPQLSTTAGQLSMQLPPPFAQALPALPPTITSSFLAIRSLAPLYHCFLPPPTPDTSPFGPFVFYINLFHPNPFWDLTKFALLSLSRFILPFFLSLHS
jgi:hypothetical protein